MMRPFSSINFALFLAPAFGRNAPQSGEAMLVGSRGEFLRQPLMRQSRNENMEGANSEMTRETLTRRQVGGQAMFVEAHAKRIGEEVPDRNFTDEGQFLERLLRSFGKNRPEYNGPQTLKGFQRYHNGTLRLFDDEGMFAFDSTISSVAIDIGASVNPLSFDADRDSGQIVFMFEPNPGTIELLEKNLETDAQRMRAEGKCLHAWDPFCSSERFLVFPAAVSSDVGYQKFHMTPNMYCGTVAGFPDRDWSKIDPKFKGWFEGCGSSRSSDDIDVATVSLASILRRIPARIPVKYMKIDAQGHDYSVLMGAGDQLDRIQYVRFEMQVDPPPHLKLVSDVPKYSDVVTSLRERGLKHEGQSACLFQGQGDFSRYIKEMECIFCREPPCKEEGRVPYGGANPRDLMT